MLKALRSFTSASSVSHSSAYACHAGNSSRHEASDFRKVVRGPRVGVLKKETPPMERKESRGAESYSLHSLRRHAR